MSAPAVVRPPETHTDLQVGGMTCGSCARRVERVLRRVDGVSAEVNYATGRVAIGHPATVAVADLVQVIVQAGYTAEPPAPPADDRDPQTLRTRVMVCAVLALPVIALAMVPAWQFDGWQWVSLVLTVPVVSSGSTTTDPPSTPPRTGDALRRLVRRVCTVSHRCRAGCATCTAT